MSVPLTSLPSPTVGAPNAAFEQAALPSAPTGTAIPPQALGRPEVPAGSLLASRPPQAGAARPMATAKPGANLVGPGPQRFTGTTVSGEGPQSFAGKVQVWSGRDATGTYAYLVTDVAVVPLGKVDPRELVAAGPYPKRGLDGSPHWYTRAQAVLSPAGGRYPQGTVRVVASGSNTGSTLNQNTDLGIVPTYDGRVHQVMRAAGITPDPLDGKTYTLPASRAGGALMAQVYRQQGEGMGWPLSAPADIRQVLGQNLPQAFVDGYKEAMQPNALDWGNAIQAVMNVAGAFSGRGRPVVESRPARPALVAPENRPASSAPEVRPQGTVPSSNPRPRPPAVTAPELPPVARPAGGEPPLARPKPTEPTRPVDGAPLRRTEGASPSTQALIARAQQNALTVNGKPSVVMSMDQWARVSGQYTRANAGRTDGTVSLALQRQQTFVGPGGVVRQMAVVEAWPALTPQEARVVLQTAGGFNSAGQRTQRPTLLNPLGTKADPVASTLAANGLSPERLRQPTTATASAPQPTIADPAADAGPAVRRPATAAPNLAPAGALVRPSVEDGIRSALHWLDQNAQPSQLQVNPADRSSLTASTQALVQPKLRQLLAGRSPTSLTDDQARQVYGDLMRSTGTALATEPAFLSQLADRFSRPLGGAEAITWQNNFSAWRQDLASNYKGISNPKGRALADVSMEVVDPASPVRQRQQFRAISGVQPTGKLPKDMYGAPPLDGLFPNLRAMRVDRGHDAYGTGGPNSNVNPRLNEVEAAAFNQIQSRLVDLKNQGALPPGANVNITITMSQSSCPSCAAAVPEWVPSLRSAQGGGIPDNVVINVDIRYMPAAPTPPMSPTRH
jgi:hypothetical protein